MVMRNNACKQHKQTYAFYPGRQLWWQQHDIETEQQQQQQKNPPTLSKTITNRKNDKIAHPKFNSTKNYKLLVQLNKSEWKICFICTFLNMRIFLRRTQRLSYGHIFHIIITKLFCYLADLNLSIDLWIFCNTLAPMKTGLNCIFRACFDKIPDLLQWQWVLRIFRDVWRKCTLSCE